MPNEPLIPLAPGDRVQHGDDAHGYRYGRISDIESGHARVDWEAGGFVWYAVRGLGAAPDEDEIAAAAREIRRENLRLRRAGCRNVST